jgi:hypothetical protein
MSDEHLHVMEITEDWLDHTIKTGAPSTFDPRCYFCNKLVEIKVGGFYVEQELKTGWLFGWLCDDCEKLTEMISDNNETS